MEQSTPQKTVRVIPARKRTPAQDGQKQKKRQRVAAYCRVSTDTSEQINSYEAQKNYYTQLIEENPEWEMAGVFADEGISGTSTRNRTEFNRMIAACKRGRIDMILTKSLSRFARNTVDCLGIVRTLKSLGIGVIFEKENINTLKESSEFLITLFSGFAQAESESISRNVAWGMQKRMEEGHAHFQYKKLLGYRKGPDGKPEIDPEEAETVRRIFRRYLEGASLGRIKRELESEGIPTAMGSQSWSYQTIRNILTSEKYIGDVLLQKTFTTDCISKTKKKNNGERPMYYIENHHEAIIPRELYKRVQEEMTRRTSKRKVMQKTAQTEQGKYSSKYALSELLVCGECGSPYKRCTWIRKGQKHIVWRCVSRLEYAKKFCHFSPTMEEERLHSAVVKGLNHFAADRKRITENAMELASRAIGGGSIGETTIADLYHRQEELSAEQNRILDLLLQDMDNPELNEQLKQASEDRQTVQEQIKELERRAEQEEHRASRLKELREWMSEQPAQFTQYDDTITRRIVERITVENRETIQIRIRDTSETIVVHLDEDA